MAVHLTHAWYGLHREAQSTANTLATALDLREVTPERWAEALDNLARAGAAAPAGEWRGIRDAGGRWLGQHRELPGWTWIHNRASLAGPGGASVEVVVARDASSLLPVLALDMALALLLGGAAFFGMRRAIRQLQSHLDLSRSESAQAQVLRVMFERSEDGMFICDGRGLVLACNPASGKRLCVAGDALLGKNLGDWIRPNAAADRSIPKGSTFPLPAGEVTVHPRGGAKAYFAQLEVNEAQLEGEARFIVGVRDLTEARKTQQTLEYLANYDSLTGLPNRALFRDRLARAMERASRGGRPMALFFLDLDRFKVVNDSLGHEAGDKLLKHVASVLASCLRGGDSLLLKPNGERATLSRLGGDEFTVIVEDINGAEDAAIIAQRLLDALALPFKMGDEELQVSASIGISLFPTDDVDLDGIIRHTDMAMYRSKALGRNTFSFFSDDLNAAVSARLSLEGSLRRALERAEFCLHYQPKANLKTGQVTGVEALLRWHCPGRGMVPPDRFIAVLEDTGLIVQAGAWVIRAACSQLAEWDQAGLPPITMAVNLSARQLRHPFLVALVQDTLRETGLDPARLELELTESLLMEDTEANRAVLAAFQKLGVKLAIDDFGTGHSSLSYLRRLDVDTLKIDRSFVMQIPNESEDCAIATAVVALGKSLQMKVVAEGVETEAQAQFLRELGCNDMQGWLLSRALPPDQLAPWLRDQHRDYLMRTQPKRFNSADLEELPDIRIPDVPRAAASMVVQTLRAEAGTPSA